MTRRVLIPAVLRAPPDYGWRRPKPEGWMDVLAMALGGMLLFFAGLLSGVALCRLF